MLGQPYSAHHLHFHRTSSHDTVFYSICIYVCFHINIVPCLCLLSPFIHKMDMYGRKLLYCSFYTKPTTHLHDTLYLCSHGNNIEFKSGWLGGLLFVLYFAAFEYICTERTYRIEPYIAALCDGLVSFARVLFYISCRFFFL